MSDDPSDDQRTPPQTTSSALHRLNLQEEAKRRMREILSELDGEVCAVERRKLLVAELLRLVNML